MESNSNWHQLNLDEVYGRIQSSPVGITSQDAEARLTKFGLNELKEEGARSPWKILWEQFTSMMVLILIAAGVVSAFLGKWQEASAIFAIVLLFGFLGFFQEYRAEKAMAALKKLAVPQVRTRRDGRVKEIPASSLVPGDNVLLEAGNLVPADLRLVGSINLRIQEAALTGESDAVEKDTQPIPEADLPLGDRTNMAYMGTTVTYGRGTGLVIATGMRTELGNIASLLQQEKNVLTPLQKRLDKLGKLLAVFGVVMAALVAVIDVIRGAPVAEAFLVAVSVAVAVVPEGLLHVLYRPPLPPPRRPYPLVLCTRGHFVPPKPGPQSRRPIQGCSKLGGAKALLGLRRSAPPLLAKNKTARWRLLRASGLKHYPINLRQLVNLTHPPPDTVGLAPFPAGVVFSFHMTQHNKSLPGFSRYSDMLY